VPAEVRSRAAVPTPRSAWRRSRADGPGAPGGAAGSSPWCAWRRSRADAQVLAGGV